MIKLSPKTILKLRDLINEETTYRSGPMLVERFKGVDRTAGCCLLVFVCFLES